MRRPPPAPPKPKTPPKAPIDPLAHMLAGGVRKAHGEDQAATFDQSELLGSPRGWIGTRNVALDRGVGNKLPLGRIIEIYGLNSAGKSTISDQIGAHCQSEGGVYMIADTERSRDRAYMRQLGVQDSHTVYLGAQTTEMLFEEVETVARMAASANLIGWKNALDLAGYATPKLPTYTHETFDPYADKKTRKAIAKFTFNMWSMDHALALRAFQEKNGLQASTIRDVPTRARLKPVVVYENGQPYMGDIRSKDFRAAYEAFQSGQAVAAPWAAAWADRPIAICWDSVGGTPTKREVEETASDQHMGVAAKVIKQNLRRLSQLIDDAAILFICLNQEYHKIEAGGYGGPKRETYGGEGLKFHSSIRIELVKGPPILDSAERVIGQEVTLEVKKNRVGTPQRRERFGLIFGRGAENAWTIYEDLKARGIISVSGGWSKFTDPSLGTQSFRGWQELAVRLAAEPAFFETMIALYHEGRLGKSR